MRPPGRRARPAPSWLAALVAIGLCPSAAAAQLLRVEGGSSSLFDAHGGALTVNGRSYSLALGAGSLDGTFTLGLLARKAIGPVSLAVGDEAVDFQLPTDLFGGSRYVPVRAAGVAWSSGHNAFRLVAGTTSDTLGAPFFRGARSSRRAVTLVFFDRPLGPRWRVFSRTAVSSRQTSIHGASLRVTPNLDAAAAAGVGNGRGYAASSVALRLPRVQANAAFVRQEVGFRRLAVDSPLAAEPTGGNVTFTVRPAQWWSVSGGHQTLIGDGGPGGAATRATVDQLAGSVNAAGVRVGVGVYRSRQAELGSVGTSLSATRALTRSLEAGAEYFRSRTDRAGAEQTLLLRLRESFGPRLSLTQTVNRSAGQTSLAVGGEFLSNPLRAAVNYQSVYAPLRDGHPFVHAVGVDLRLNVLDRVQVQGATYVTPGGQLRHTISGSVIEWRSGGGSRAPRGYKFPPYVVRGVVCDGDSRPVAGAVIYLDGQVVITDEAGRFSLRSPGPEPVRVRVAPDEFLAGRYEVTSAPATATPADETRAHDVLIVVRRL